MNKGGAFGFRRFRKEVSTLCDTILVPVTIRRPGPGHKPTKKRHDGVEYFDVEQAMQAVPNRSGSGVMVRYEQIKPIYPEQWQQLVYQHTLAGMRPHEIARIYPLNAKKPKDVEAALAAEMEIVAREQAKTNFKVLSLGRCEDIINSLWDRRAENSAAVIIERFIKLELMISGEFKASSAKGADISVNVVAVGQAGPTTPALSYSSFATTQDLADASEIIDATDYRDLE